jgi:hypothetical protein
VPVAGDLRRPGRNLVPPVLRDCGCSNSLETNAGLVVSSLSFVPCRQEALVGGSSTSARPSPNRGPSKAGPRLTAVKWQYPVDLEQPSRRPQTGAHSWARRQVGGDRPRLWKSARLALWNPCSDERLPWESGRFAFRFFEERAEEGRANSFYHRPRRTAHGSTPRRSNRRLSARGSNAVVGQFTTRENW